MQILRFAQNDRLSRRERGMTPSRKPDCIDEIFRKSLCLLYAASGTLLLRSLPNRLGGHMLDLVYIAVGLVLFVACWASTKGCDRL